MARVFITGSSDGLGRMAAELLIQQGHSVVLHARHEQRAKEALAAVPGAETVAIGDLTSVQQTLSVAEQVNALGAFDAVIHNAGIGYRESRRLVTEEGAASRFCRQHSCAIYPDGPDSKAEAPCISQFRIASKWRRQLERPGMGATPLAWAASLQRHQAA